MIRSALAFLMVAAFALTAPAQAQMTDAQKMERNKKNVVEFYNAVLNEKNAEYHYLSSNLKDRVLPRIVLWPYEHPEHFRPGAKQRWVKK